jgi:asparaginyl-tRNA synthetase
MKYRIIEIFNAPKPTMESKEVIIQGWVRSNRESKAGMSFVTVNDGSCVSTIQIIAPDSLANYQTEVLKLSKDCSVTVTGKLQLSPRQELELLAQQIIVHGFVQDAGSYPMSLKKHSIEHLREYAHLRIRTNLISSVMRVRNTISFSIHKFLQSKGFYWVHTPIITSSDCEGAGEMFQVTSLKIANPPKTPEGTINYKDDFFGKEAFLTVSGQLNGECYCLGLSRVYTFGPTFRAENSNTTRHLAEFWMIEPEIAFSDLNDVIIIAQDLLQFVCQEVLENNREEIEFLSKYTEEDLISRINNIINNEFAQIDYIDAIALLQKSGHKFEQEVYWGCDLASEHERYLCEEIMKKPTVVKNYPKEIKAFYMRLNSDQKTVAAMDILAPGIGEIIGGSQREERVEILIEQMKLKNIDPSHMQWYVDLRTFGTTPHSGFGLGLERLVAYITNIGNIRDAIPFPRTPNNLEY